MLKGINMEGEFLVLFGILFFGRMFRIEYCWYFFRDRKEIGRGVGGL